MVLAGASAEPKRIASDKGGSGRQAPYSELVSAWRVTASGAPPP